VGKRWERDWIEVGKSDKEVEKRWERGGEEDKRRIEEGQKAGKRWERSGKEM